jgi:hypothetical protein
MKERGFRSEQAFILAACENELRRGENTDAATQFEARVAATLTNLAKQLQGLHTLAHAQVALTDVLLKYVITSVVEPPEDALPAARVRARLRYEELVRAAAEQISSKNRDTLKGMIADGWRTSNSFATGRNENMAETKSRGSTQSCFYRYFSWFNRHVPRQNISLLTTPTAGQKASIAVDQQLGAEVTRKNLSIQPTLKIPVGYRFNDILFEAPYTPVEM